MAKMSNRDWLEAVLLSLLLLVGLTVSLSAAKLADDSSNDGLTWHGGHCSP